MESSLIIKNINSGIECLKKFDYKNALEYFLILKNIVIDANYYIGLCYYKLNQYDKSYEHLKIIEENENISIEMKKKIYELCGEVNYKLNNIPQAIIYFKKVEEFGIKKNNMLGLCYHFSKQYELAIKHYLLAIEEKDFLALNNLANTYVHIQNYTKAIEYFEESEKKGFKFNNLGIGNCYFSIGQNEKAIEYYKKELEKLDPTIHKILIYNLNETIGDIYVILNNINDASKHYSLAHGKENKLVFSKLIKTLYFSGQYDDVINNLKKVPLNNPILTYIIGFCYYRINNLSEAKKYFEIVLNQNFKMALEKFKPYAYINEDNKYEIDIDKMHAINSLMSLDANNKSKKRINLSEEILSSNKKTKK